MKIVSARMKGTNLVIGVEAAHSNEVLDGIKRPMNSKICIMRPNRNYEVVIFFRDNHTAKLQAPEWAKINGISLICKFVKRRKNMPKLDYEIELKDAGEQPCDGQFWLIKIFNAAGQVVRTITQTSRRNGEDARYEDAVQTAKDYIRRNG